MSSRDARADRPVPAALLKKLHTLKRREDSDAARNGLRTKRRTSGTGSRASRGDVRSAVPHATNREVLIPVAVTAATAAAASLAVSDGQEAKSGKESSNDEDAAAANGNGDGDEEREEREKRRRERREALKSSRQSHENPLDVIRPRASVAARQDQKHRDPRVNPFERTRIDPRRH